MEDTRTREELLAEIARLRQKIEADGAASSAAGKDGAGREESIQKKLSRHIRPDEIIQDILEVTSNVAGGEFIRTLVRQLAASLEMDYVFVAELVSDNMSRTLALWAKGSFVDNFEYDLEGTPCGEVQNGQACSFARNVQELFPEDSILKEMGIESYVGIPLMGAGGKPIGILTGMDTKPIEDEEKARAILRLFALRAALELERKKAEDDRKRGNELLQAVMDNAPAVVYIKDGDGRFLFVNRYFFEKFRAAKEDIIGRTDHDLFPKELADRYRENDRKVFGAGRAIEFEESAVEADGKLHTCMSVKFPIPGIPGGICGISTDITNRKQTEEALKRSDERLKEAQAIAHIGNWDWHIAENTLYWSDEIYRIFGLRPQEFGATYEAFLTSVHPDDREAVKLSVVDSLNSHKPYEINHRIVRPDGTERIVQEKAAVIRGSDGKAIRMAGTVQDITEHRKMEAELLKAQKLDSIGVLAGGIAHDFNNLLLGILGNVSVAKTYCRPGEKVTAILDDIEKAAMRTKGLTRQLLTFSKGGQPVREAVSMEQVAKDTAHIVLRGSNILCDYSFQEGVWPVDADQGQLSQALNNIIMNSMQAMPDGGNIRISSENIEVTEETPLPLRPGRYVKTTIKDRGIGIPPKLLPKVFDPFFTTRQKASGLGLAVTYSIIKKHQGHIGLDSQVGNGTAVHVYLPAAKEAAGKDKDMVVKGSGRILVMDDEELVRDVSFEMLKVLGYEAEFAVDGREAIETYSKAKAEGKPFDLVILDLTVPGGMGGKEAIEKLLAMDPSVKAIVSSGYSKDPILAEFKRFGFSGVIAKPYRVSEFSKAVMKVLKGEPGPQ